MKRDESAVGTTERHAVRWPSRILLSAPDGRTRDMLATAFLSDGYEVAETDSGTETLEYLSLVTQCRLRVPDVIVLALWLKNCSAIRVARAMREAAWSTPVLVLGRVPSPLLHELGNTRAIRPDVHVDELRAAVLEAHVAPSAAYAS